jgi:titin
MAVTYGAFDYSGNNGMQVGVEVTWSAVTSASTSVTASYKLYTNNQYQYNDNGEVLAFSVKNGGTTVDSGSITFNNNSASGGVQRGATQTYTYTYAASSYDTSPVSLAFGASVSGTYNGSAPTVGLSVAVPARPSQAPTAPTSVTATPNNGSISVSFAAPTTAGSGGVSYYQYSSDNINWTGSAGSSAPNPFPISGTNGTSTTGYVRAVSLYGTGKFGPSASASATPRTVPSAPTSFAADTSVFGQITLSWAAPSSNGGNAVIGYRLRTGTTLGSGTLLYEGTGTSYTHTGLSPYTDYSYNIIAYNAAGESTSTTNATLTAKTMGGIAKVWNGSSYIVTLPKVWNGTAWLDAQARMWNSTEWKHGI